MSPGRNFGNRPGRLKTNGPVFQFVPPAEKYLPKLIELGAMPGNHLVYFNKEFGYQVRGNLDLVESFGRAGTRYG